MVQEKVKPVRTQIRSPDSKSSGDYYYFRLPDEITLIGLEEDDEVYLDVVEEEIEGETVRYIRGSSEGIGRHGMQIQRREDFSPELYFQCPAAFSGEHGYRPFTELEEGDWIVIEILVEEQEFRIYGYEDWRLRETEITKEEGLSPDIDVRTVVPAIPAFDGDEYIDLSHLEEDVPSQRFEIKAFDGQHQVFVEAAEENPVFRKMAPGVGRYSFYGGPEILRYVEREHGLPVRRAEKFEISWTPEQESHRIGGRLKIFEEYDAESVNVELPEKGTYTVKAEFDGESGGHWLAADPDEALTNAIRESWSAFLFIDEEEEEEVPTIYIPVPREEEGRGFWDNY